MLGHFPVTAFHVSFMTHLARSQQCTPRRKCCCKLHWLCQRSQQRTIPHTHHQPCCGQHSCQTSCWSAQCGLMSTLREGTGTSQCAARQHLPQGSEPVGRPSATQSLALEHPPGNAATCDDPLAQDTHQEHRLW